MLAVATVAVVVTALVYGIPPVPFAYPLPGATVFASAFTSMSALAICILFAMRHERSRRRTDLLVASLFGATTLIEGVLPLVAETVQGTADITFWARVIARSVVALGLCVTAWLPERMTRPNRRGFAIVAAASVALASLAIGWTFAAMSDLPASVNDATNPRAALAGGATVLGFRLAGTILLISAAVGLTRKSARLDDRVLAWLASGAIVLAAARFHDYLYPSLHNDWVTTADMLRVVAFWLVLFGLLHEVAEIWRRRGADARAQERRVLAAELHDGLAQELAYLTTQSALAERDPTNSERLLRIRAAAERALSETRLCIAEYAETDPCSLDRMILELGHDVETDYGCRVVLDLEEIDVRPRTAHELGRVAREALVNAARHGHPDEIVVRLETRAGVVRLSIIDDGGGILDSDEAPAFTFGLTSMHERALRLGGVCSIESAPQGGTRVAIEVPQR